jgi:hypothetical protein
MKKVILLLFIGFGFSSVVFGQTIFSAYRGTWSPTVSYYSFKEQRKLETGTPSTNFDENFLTANGFTLGINGSASLCSLLFKEDSRWYFGDYWAGGFGVASMKRINSPGNGGKTNSFGGTANFDLGLSTGFAIGERLEIGLQALFVHLYYTTDLKDQLAFQQSPLIIPSVKYANLMLTCGFGKGQIGGNGFRADTTKILNIETRFFNDEADRYFFVRYERNYQTSPVVTSVTELVSTQPFTLNTYGYRESVNASMISIGFGLTY